LYRNNKIQDLTKVGNYIGNPDLEPEKTVAYEIGVEQQLTDDIKFDITGYYKDVTNLMNWEKYVGRTIQNIELNVYTNADYGNIKGLELTLSKRPGRFWGGSISKRPGRFWGGSINYTYSVAKGRSSGATGGSGSFTDVKRMNILDFDQTHTVNANLILRTPVDFGIKLGPVHPFAGWATTFLFDYGSGLPYSSYGNNKVNDKRRPWTSTTDFKLSRTFTVAGLGLNMFMDVFNLFNRKNVNWIGSAQYYDSGDPEDSSIKGDPSVVRRNSDGSYARNPQAYSTGRRIRFGIALTF
jgi:outer membrane receptor protein involved in Fe transport